MSNADQPELDAGPASIFLPEFSLGDKKELARLSGTVSDQERLKKFGFDALIAFDHDIKKQGQIDPRRDFLQAMFDTNGPDAEANQKFAQQMSGVLDGFLKLPVVTQNTILSKPLSQLADTARRYSVGFLTIDADGTPKTVTPPNDVSLFLPSKVEAHASSAKVSDASHDGHAPTAKGRDAPDPTHVHSRHHHAERPKIDADAETEALNAAESADPEAMARMYANRDPNSPARVAFAAELRNVGLKKESPSEAANKLVAAASEPDTARQQAHAEQPIARSNDLQEVYVGDGPAAHPLIDNSPKADQSRRAPPQAREGIVYRGNLRVMTVAGGIPDTPGPIPTPVGQAIQEADKSMSQGLVSSTTQGSGFGKTTLAPGRGPS